MNISSDFLGSIYYSANSVAPPTTGADSQGKFLTFNMEEDSFYVPMVLANTAVEQRNLGYTAMVLPIEIITTISIRRTASTVLNSLTSMGMSPTFTQVKTTKGDIYYGNNIAILDKDFNPLLIPTVTLSHYYNEDNNYSGYRVTGVQCMLDYKLFSNDGIFEKTVIKQIIPALANCRVDAYISCIDYNMGVDIVIKDLSPLMSTVALPSASTTKESLTANIFE